LTAAPPERLVVLVGEDVGPANLARILAVDPRIEVIFCPEIDSFVAAAPRADVIFTKRLPAAAVASAERLRWVQAGTAGVEGMLAAGLRDRARDGGVILTNASGAHGVTMAEVVLAMMLAFATRLHTLLHAQAQRRRARDEVVARKFELEGQTLLVLGLGDIGGTLARKARLLGVRVIGIRRDSSPSPDVDEQHRPDALRDVLPRADHVALCLPLTAETRGIIGESELRAMRPTAYIYNVGRGASIDGDALLRALREGWIAGAGLDVTDPEPLPADSPLWDLPNVILSQHTSGSSPRNADRITDILIDNLARYLRGAPLRNRIDPVRGY
jgi:phosphoglycerate dehydrogenase-like enzyme